VRKDTSEKRNNINVFFILLFIVSSSNIFYLILWIRPDFEFLQQKNTKFIQYSIAEEKGEVTPNSLSSIDMRKVLETLYLQKKSTEALLYTEQDITFDILKDGRFQENGTFNKDKFLLFLQKMQKVLNIKIETHDYIKYLQVKKSQKTLKKITNFVVKECDIPKLINGSVALNVTKIIHGIKIVVDVKPKKYKFSPQEIEKFIKEQKHMRVSAYTIPEKRSGLIIRVALNSISIKIIEAVNYFLKQQTFDREKMYKFLLQASIDSQFFTKEIIYKDTLENSRVLDLKSPNYKSFPLDDYLSIEELRGVSNNEDTKLLFENNFYKKNFNLLGDAYCKVIVQEIVPEKNTEITEAFLKEFVLPTMEAYAREDEKLAIYYNLMIQQNSGKEFIKWQNYHHEKIQITARDYMYGALCLSTKDSVYILADGFGNPYLFIVTGVETVPNLGMQNKNLEGFLQNIYVEFLESLFFHIFEISYNKKKKNLQA